MSAWLDAGWPAPPGVRALTTTRFGLGVSQTPFDTFNLGMRCGDAADAVIENRRQLETALALPSAPRWLRQIHGADIARFDSAYVRADLAVIAESEVSGSRPGALLQGEPEADADASVTSTPGTVLAILTADCLPVVLAARDGSEIAAAHAGWRGLAGGVLEATLAAMVTAPAQLMAWLGPAAGPQAYEIGQDVFDAFVSRDAHAADAFVGTRPGHWRVDLYTLARQRLVAAGVNPSDIHGGDRCTISDPARFFSHRRDGRSGRVATLAWIQT